MAPAATASRRLKSAYQWLGSACWLLIIPVKVVRCSPAEMDPILVGVVPSFLGPPGLLLMVLSIEKGRLGHLTLWQATVLSATIAVAVEFAQTLPWVSRLYRFDWLDVAATMLGISAGVVGALALHYAYRVSR